MGPLCLNQFKTRSHFGSFTPTFGLSNESEQIPYVLKQGSPDMSCVAMTTCNRKDKNNCHSFTESCKYFYIWGTRFCPREAFTQAQTCSQSTVINIILYNSCIHREKRLWVKSGSRDGCKLSAASCRQHKKTLIFLNSVPGC